MDARFLTINNKSISYFDEGSGFPLVLIHGWIVCKEAFIPVTEVLAKSFRVIVPDLPGFGDSEELGTRHTIDEYVLVLEEFLDKLGVDQLCLMGASLGGTVAFKYALQQRDAVKKLIVQAPVFYWQQLPRQYTGRVGSLVKFLSRFEALRRRAKARFGDYLVTERLPRIRAHTNDSIWETVEPVIRMVQWAYDKKMSLRAATEVGVNLVDLDMRTPLKELMTETLIVWGDEDTTLHKEWGSYLQDLLPHSTYIEIDGATHDLLVEKYPQFCKEVFAFLDRVS